MVSIKVPYSTREIELKIPHRNLVGILSSKATDYQHNISCSEADLVNSALDNPVSSLKLEELAEDKKNIVIITSDHTRPVPSRITMPILLERIRRVNSAANIKILVATGYHRATTTEELMEKFGRDIVENEQIVVHDAFDNDSLINLGILPSGGELWLNRLAIEADLLIAEGFIEPHFFAGFSGGRKSVLPGVAGAQTVLANHCSEFIASHHARTGNLNNNPIHHDMLFAARKAQLAFILNVVLNEQKEIIQAYAGDSEQAHLEGCEFIRELSKVDKITADIVVVTNGGYPLDQNIYQTVKGMTAAEATCNPAGVIIMIAGCEDGHGGESFYHEMAQAATPEDVIKQVMTVDRNETLPDQWEFQILARILVNHRVIMVTDLCDPAIIKAMHMEHAFDFPDALKQALDIKGADASITVIPDGVSVIVQ
jgi:lactate racemase